MKRVLLALLGLWFIGAATASAQSLACAGTANMPLKPMPGEQIAVSTTAIGFTASKITVPGTADQAIMAVCSVQSNSVRYRDDNTAPTTTVGQLVIASAATPAQVIVCGRMAVVQIKFIRVSADATVDCGYYAPQN